MTGMNTATNAAEYWQRYYAEDFEFGLGTEDILAMLMQIPPVGNWADLGCGSESLLWAIALRAQRLVAVDADPHRLAILRHFAAQAQPRGMHTTALRLCGRTGAGDFTARCRSLAATITANCLTGRWPSGPHLPLASFDLVTQFGLLGLCPDAEQFTANFEQLHHLLAPGGWTAGANWIARDATGRVELTEQLYRNAAARAGVHLLLLHRIPSADPEFPAVWTYVGQTRRTP